MIFWYAANWPRLALLQIANSRSYSGSSGRRGTAVAGQRRRPTCTSTSGFDSRLSSQAGGLRWPPLEATTISRSPSLP